MQSRFAFSSPEFLLLALRLDGMIPSGIIAGGRRTMQKRPRSAARAANVSLHQVHFVVVISERQWRCVQIPLDGANEGACRRVDKGVRENPI